jgi:hypothetical protein
MGGSERNGKEEEGNKKRERERERGRGRKNRPPSKKTKK